MPEFWLDNFFDIFNIHNFELNTTDKKYNVLSLLIIIIGLIMVFKTKKPFYFAIVIVLLSLIILLRNCKSCSSKFNSVNDILSNRFYLDIQLRNNVMSGSNMLDVNNALNIKKGDIILIDNGMTSETAIVYDVITSQTTNLPIITLTDKLKNNYSMNNTTLYKVSNNGSDTVPPPDPNKSIQGNNSTLVSSPDQMALNSAVVLPPLLNGNRTDVNLELSSYKSPGEGTNYLYQGPPYGDLSARQSTINNPMGTINVVEYGATPTMYGTANVGDTTVLPDGRTVSNDYFMDSNLESTVSMRVDDLLFHKGNAQSRFSPMPVDTMPDNQEAFAHFCYRSPTNLINPKYASIFVNDPDKFKLITQLAKATGTENGGGGGGGGLGR
jgi:hypothetical protein